MRNGLLFLALIPSLLASSETRSVTLEELGGVVTKGQKVKVLLKSGAYGRHVRRSHRGRVEGTDPQIGQSQRTSAGPEHRRRRAPGQRYAVHSGRK